MPPKRSSKAPLNKLPKLPQSLDTKIYKTGQTRGADDDVIYQNRVLRNSTVLIPFSVWKNGFSFPDDGKFENGFIVLIPPEEYFKTENIDRELEKYSLKIGNNALVFYETREQWEINNPRKLDWKPATKRIAPLGGQYIARVPATTAANNGQKITEGFNETKAKGAGIRVYEYASQSTIELCRLQLEALFWHCYDSIEVTTKYGMTRENSIECKNMTISSAEIAGLLDYERLIDSRVLNKDNNTVCPLCCKMLSCEGFFNKMEQACGREVNDLTVTKLNLFHIIELKVNEYNHRPYNLGWGHHHCNVVTRDNGISQTIDWMKGVLESNQKWKTP